MATVSKTFKSVVLVGFLSSTLLFSFQNCSSSLNTKSFSVSADVPVSLVALNANSISNIQRSAIEANATNQTKKVGILYLVWHCMANDPSRNKVIDQALVDGKWGNIPEFHWRSIPKATGNITSYCARNKDLVNKHFEMLEAAKIDYLVVDFTNQRFLPGTADESKGYVAPQSMIDGFQNLIDVSVARQSKIKIVPWVDFRGNLLPDLVRRLGEHKEAQFLFENKPLILASWDKARGQDQAQSIVDSYSAQGYSVRKMWGLTKGQLAPDVWSFMEICQPGFRESQGNTPCNQYVNREMASVSNAYQETVMTDFSTSVPKFSGRTFLSQLETAQRSGAGLILLNSWNEWIAQRWCLNVIDGLLQVTHECYVGTDVDKKIGNHFPYQGRPVFVDMFNREYSRDFEPDTQNDEYYKLMVSSIAALKGLSKPNPMPIPIPTSVDGGWSDWQVTSDCNKTCGGGVRIESRFCNSPAPSNQGKMCSGSSTREIACNTQACASVGSSKVLGQFDSITLTSDKRIRLQGWACSEGVDKAIAVHIYVNGPAGSGRLVTADVAALGRENQVKTACKTADSKHGFDIVLSESDSNQYSNKQFYVHGINANPNLENRELEGNGKFAPMVNATLPVPYGYSEVQDFTVYAMNVSGRTGDWWCTQHFGGNLGGKWVCLDSNCGQDASMGQIISCGKVKFAEIKTVNVGSNAGVGRTGEWWCTQHFGVNLGGTWECLGNKCAEDAEANQNVDCGKR